MKYCLISALIFTAAAANASFELMLIGDSTNGAIHRYDPINRVYLGSFGQGQMTSGAIIDMALDQSGNRVFVRQSSIVNVFDYNSGLILNSFAVSNVGALTYRSSTNELLLSASTQILRFSDTGVNLGAYYSLAGANFSAITATNTHVFATNGTNGTMVRLSGVSTGTLQATATSIASVAGDSYKGAFVSEDNARYYAISSTDRVPYNWNGVNTGNILFPGTSSLTTVTAGTRGHGYFGYMLGTTATGLGIQKFMDSGSNTAMFGQVALPSQIASVNAAVTIITPEPGTILALGAGLAFLAKRRNSKS